jgi:hypothetical protein
VAGSVAATPLLQSAAQVWKLVHITDVEQVPLIKVGARAV